MSLKILNVLRIDSSSRQEGSVSRQIGDDLLRRLEQHFSVHIKSRDLIKNGLPFIDADWIDKRGAQDPIGEMALSDELIDELRWADTLLINSPLYNFSIPAVLKAWIDLVARPGITFRYTDKGSEGLLQDKQAVFILSSGGTAIGGPAEFASAYMKHVLDFMGIQLLDTIGISGLERAQGVELQKQMKDLDNQLAKVLVNLQFDPKMETA